MPKRMIALVAVLGLVGVAGRISGQGKQSSVVQELMQKKLKSAQHVLEGLALADFAKITRSAEDLIQHSKTLEWRVLRTPRYELHTNEFRRAAENLIDKAKQKNIDGAALAYVELTLSCVRCHQHVRDVREARGPARRGEDFTSQSTTGVRHGQDRPN